MNPVTIIQNENAINRGKPRAVLNRGSVTTTNSAVVSREALTDLTNNVKPQIPLKTTGFVGKIKKPTKSKGKKNVSGVSEEDGKKEKLKSKVTDPMIIDEIVDWEDIDINDLEDPQAVAEYVNEIYDFMMEKERLDKIGSGFLSNQTDVNDKMRAILVDWLVEVHKMFKLLPETLYLSVYIIDHFLNLKIVTREKLQLVGITSMLIGAKYEEIYAPECNDFVYISDGAYTKDQILSMEQLILNTLNFNLTSPSTLHFLRRYSKAAGSDYTMHTLCKYIIELMLLDSKFLKYVPSQIASGSVYLARLMTHKTPLWTSTLEHYTTYSEEEVRVVAVEMNDLLKRSQKSTLKAIKKKYTLPKYAQVATIPVVDL